MNKLRTEYLQAMGVDLYVPRPQFNSVSEPSSLMPEEQEIAQETVPESRNMPPVETEPEFVSPEPAAQKQTPTDLEKKPEEKSEESAEHSEAAVSESKPKPLYFLWQQVGDLLFLTAASEKQTAQETKLLGAVVASLSRPERVERGTGNWPLIGHESGSLSEGQDFLASFVTGRAELCTPAMTLILFGEQSQKQFVEIDGEFDDILGSKIPSQTGLKEFRLVPALVDMLEKPYLKSLAWQSIKDLRGT